MPEPTASGADLARQSLAAARAAAKNSPTPAAKKPRTRVQRAPRGAGRDPIGFGDLLGKVSAEQGWPQAIEGGNVLARWPELCPQFAATVQPTGYDPERRVLELRPSTHATASGLRLLGGQLAKQINDKVGSTVVRAIRVLPVGRITVATSEPSLSPSPGDRPTDPQAPVKTRETASPGYRATLDAALTHRPDKQPTNPYVLEALERQEAALRANRQPEAEHRDAVWAQDTTSPTRDSVEESLARARAYARQQTAGRAPRRAFDVA